MNLAACRGLVPPDTEKDPFFPSRGQTSEDAVLRYCLLCSVKSECDGYADRIKAKVGIWGGKRRTRSTHGPESERHIA